MAYYEVIGVLAALSAMAAQSAIGKPLCGFRHYISIGNEGNHLSAHFVVGKSLSVCLLKYMADIPLPILLL